ncbi:MAG: hypothetical protein M4579_001195 [Chaenotheca gracillima]|nr:MAG: hypothetical protein M4579_001195 [Chaenotheca gracillima]
MPILPLPPEDVAKISSSITITSLNEVVVGLLQNSLDAEAIKIDITVDFTSGSCTVEDNGYGISPEDFLDSGGLGKAHQTSKFDAGNETHGRSGVFLSALAALSLLTITSHHYLHRSHNTLIFHHSKQIARLLPAPIQQHLQHPNHGTRVTVQDLFGAMPVRVKQRAATAERSARSERDWDNLKVSIIGNLLAWRREISATVTEVKKNRRFVIRCGNLEAPVTESSCSNDEMALVSRTRSILAQASYISRESFDSWIPLSASTTGIKIRGAISLEPAPNKSVQFLALHVSPIVTEKSNNIFLDEINSLFAASCFGMLEAHHCDPSNDEVNGDWCSAELGRKTKARKIQQKGIDRWPKFFLRIESNVTDDYCPGSGNGSIYGGHDLAWTLRFIRAIIVQFLSDHKFRPRVRSSSCKESLSTAINRHDNGEDGRRHGRSPWTLQHGHNAAYQEPSPNINRSPLGPLRTATLMPKATDVVYEGDNLRRSMGKSHVSTLIDGVELPNFSVGRSYNGQKGLPKWSKIKTAKTNYFVDNLEDGWDGIKDRYNISTQQSRDARAKRDQELGPRPHSSPSMLQTPQGRRHSLRRTGGMNLRAKVSDESLIDELNTELVSQPSALEEVSDDFTSWLNPISKRGYFVNRRTGLATDADIQRPQSASARLEPTNSACITPPVATAPGLDSLDSPKLKSRPSEWLEHLLKKHENPIFRPTEQPFHRLPFVDSTKRAPPHLHCAHAFSAEASPSAFLSTFSSKLSKDLLRHAEIIAQVDHKFLLVKMGVRISESPLSRDDCDVSTALVLIDQHAADERWRVEKLLEDLCSPPTEFDITDSKNGLASAVKCTYLAEPIGFPISPKEGQLFEVQKSGFADWGVLYDLESHAQDASYNSSQEKLQVVVRALPTVISERCRLEPSLLVHMMRKEVWQRQRSLSLRETDPDLDAMHASVGPRDDTGFGQKRDLRRTLRPNKWIRRIRNCPQGILDMLSSRACRSHR